MAPGPAGRAVAWGPAYQVRAVLENAEWQAVGYRLHDVLLLPTDEEDRVVGHLGPDVLGPDWDPAEAARRLAADPDRPVGDALLDQRVLAGVGNLYKSETLFLCGISPYARIREVPDVAKVVATAHQLLRANRDHPEQSTTGSTRRGDTHWVFERARRPCRRCGTPIEVGEQGDAAYARLTYWCPHCQPAA